MPPTNPTAIRASGKSLSHVWISFLPESPRWLISKDRVEEAQAILVKYHAEGDADSEFVKAEMAQIHTTISLEVEASKKSWADLFATSGMRRRLLITSMLGLFTQWSGNTLISYYLGDLLEMIGMTNSTDVQKINVSIACWSMVCATVVALLVVKIRRRVMYLMCTISLLLCYIAWTISMQKAQTAAEAGTPNGSANIATLFFIYAYSPCYNMGYNALTYSKFLLGLLPHSIMYTLLTLHLSVHGRGLALRGTVPWYCCVPALWPVGRLLYHFRQSHWA